MSDRLPTPDECYEVAKRRGKFEGVNPLGDAMYSLRCELYECDRADEKKDLSDSKHGLKTELAHICIVARSIAGMLNFDLDALIIREHQWNLKRAEEGK
jgi:hypothetical protein